MVETSLKTKPAGRLNRRVDGRVWFRLIFCCSVLGFLVSALPAYAVLAREAYLQLVTPTSITIVWRTDLASPSDSQVQYGTDAGNLDQTATGSAVIPPSNSIVKDHVVTITGSGFASRY